MAEVTMRVNQIMELKLWDKVCDQKGLNPRVVNVGLMSEDELITFDDEFKEEEIDDIDYGDFTIICPRCKSENVYTMTQSHRCNDCRYER